MVTRAIDRLLEALRKRLPHARTSFRSHLGAQPCAPGSKDGMSINGAVDR